MRQYILFGCGAVVLGGAAWYFGRPTPPASRPEPTIAVADLPKAEAPKPPRIAEVIDLARAYEPVREPEEVHPGGVDPASFIQVPEAAERIPPARDLDDPYADVIRSIQEMHFGPLWCREVSTERIDVMPRDVTAIQNGLLNFVPTPRVPGELVFIPMGVPYTVEAQRIPPIAAIGIPVEELKVMPRILPAR